MTIDPGTYELRPPMTEIERADELARLFDLLELAPALRALQIEDRPVLESAVRRGAGPRRRPRSLVFWEMPAELYGTGAMVPDLTRSCWPSVCTARTRRSLGTAHWTCTRRAGHTGRHAAGDGCFILAVWGGVA